MSRTSVKLLIGGLVLTGAVAYLSLAGVRKGWVYYVQVDQFLSDKQYQSQRVRLTGKVAPEGMVVDAARLTATFSLAGQVNHIPVAYHGVIPEMFKSGCDVVVEGQVDRAGTFQADVMMTKCASKYQGEHPSDVPGKKP